EKYRSQLKRRGVRIIGARFTEQIDLENADLHHELWLDQSSLEQGANLVGARSSNSITFDGSKIAGTLNLYGLQTEGYLSIKKSSIFELDLTSARIGKDVDLSGSTSGPIVMNGLYVGVSLAMGDEAKLQSISLIGAHVGNQFSLFGSTVSGDLNMEAIRI